MILGQSAVVRLPSLLRRPTLLRRFQPTASSGNLAVNFPSRNGIFGQKWSPFVALRLARSYAGVPATSESLIGSSARETCSKLETPPEENRNLEEILKVCLETRSVGEFFPSLRLISRKISEEDVPIPEGKLSEIRAVFGKIRELANADESLTGANLLSVAAFCRYVDKQWPSTYGEVKGRHWLYL